MKYQGIVYRPPSEGNSLIVQVTIGCSHGKCAFCSMYREKQFRPRPMEEVISDLHYAKNIYGGARRIFLADGDPFVLATDKLLHLLNNIRQIFPECERISIYGTPQNALRKTREELRALADAGLVMAYIGSESGDDEILRRVNKGVCADEIISAINRLQEAGIRVSVTFISGLGGAELSEKHALGIARVITESKPSYAALLALLLESSAPMYELVQNGVFTLMQPPEIARETQLALKYAKPESDCIFRSNHASNYISLKGILPHDNDRLIRELDTALMNGAFKEEGFRSL